MAFKQIAKAKTAPDNPEVLFNDLRTRKITGLLAHQADILRSYCEKDILKKSDVALQLPTGSGKTLVGLLIAEWRRRKFNERVVYLCPTRQLVNQVVRQATQDYGLSPTGFTGKQRDYPIPAKNQYLQAQAVAVTTYSSLFSTPTFFGEPNIIIFDDAHAGENFIAQRWSVEVSKEDHRVLFDVLAGLLQHTLSPSEYGRMTSEEDSRSGFDWVDKIPAPVFYDLVPELTAALNKHTPATDLRYPWARIRDHLVACQMYVSCNSILIRPVIPPTRTHAPFAYATQRIYMSATLGKGGELERLSGIEEIVRLPVPRGWDKQGIGRRLFLFPELSMDEDDAADIAFKMVAPAKRALILAPNSRDVENFRQKLAGLRYHVFETADLEAGKESFIKSQNAVALLANRYEGIDFVDDECRLLIVAGIARATNLQERFLINRTCSVVLYNDRIITRIVQAIGRCTRSPNDYSTVVILGDELSRYLIQKEHRGLLHPELQGEIEFGVQQSQGCQPAEFLDNLGIFLRQGCDWQEADTNILELRDEATQSQLPAVGALHKAVQHEVRYQYALWSENYTAAVDECRSVLNELNGDELKGYRAFWNYLAGSAAWIGHKKGIAKYDAVARDFYDRAAGSAPAIRWLSRLAEPSAELPADTNKEVLAVIERLEAVLEKLGTANNKKFEAEVKQIWEGIVSGNSDAFEEGHKRLGMLLGYEADNVNSTAAPDPWWIADDSLCVVFEDHYPENQEGCIGAAKVRQAVLHPQWIRDNGKVPGTARIIPVIISPREAIEKDAVPYAGDVRYWNMREFQLWSQKAIAEVRKLRRTFPGSGDLVWRAKAIEAYDAAGIAPRKLIDVVLTRKLQDLPTEKREKKNEGSTS